MRILISLGLGLALASVAVPAISGTLAEYTAKPGQYKLENGVRVYRIQSTASQRLRDPVYQVRKKQRLKQAKTKAFERGYEAGFEAGYDKATQKRRTRKNRYNYGRRYSTSGQNPRYSRFRSNISYGRPAYVAVGR